MWKTFPFRCGTSPIKNKPQSRLTFFRLSMLEETREFIRMLMALEPDFHQMKCCLSSGEEYHLKEEHQLCRLSFKNGFTGL